MRVSVLSCSRDVEFRTNLSTSTLRHSFHVMPLHSKEGVTIRAAAPATATLAAAPSAATKYPYTALLLPFLIPFGA
ncbi:hypothetical protein DTO207G8_75 [Paecilomyces variotii]|nr:hypothetical protein DTO032I3_3780 [Paecilomyces variotii]KAJ9226013.1 hypothetical protein DTO169C6_1652 [Paecilomyces variotii]KAJ9260925.1 hypothetical protein DTO207G8_75 [Paecilomyces variotii]KAJ9266889.1 hypothetical protein DTO195F2_824 [Paecilomyces variotii]KAJ9276808.1 hypothetical protein DTO021D3_6413 [Paecilomyces variotii]